MSISLSKLGELIENEINVFQHDVAKIYHPNERELISLCNLCLDNFAVKREELFTKGKLQGLPETQKVFITHLEYINKNIKEHGYWSFWHVTSLVVVTCFYYMELLNEGKNSSVDLNDHAEWERLDAPVLAINFIAGQWYKEPLGDFWTQTNKANVDIKMVCEFLKSKIEILTVKKD